MPREQRGWNCGERPTVRYPVSRETRSRPAVYYAGVPNSVVVAAADGELVARLHFEAEHTNVLVVTVELLNGCLASTEIETMTAKVVNPHIPEFPVR